MSAYDEAFYESQMAESLASARLYLGHLWKLVQPSSVVDVGCGRGMWLKAAGELGATRLLGLDGNWNRQDLMSDPAIRFRPIDLNQRFKVEPCDIAVSLEVAEHLRVEAARGFVASLASAADVIVFGAAYSGQGGTEHINERPMSYWVSLFAAENFDVFDVFRPTFWADSRIPYWYRQNTMVYARRGSATSTAFKGTEPRFLDCVHPDMYSVALTMAQPREIGFTSHARALVPSFSKALRRRLGSTVKP
jgi:SAM-dependent methyltransferase